MTTTTPFTVLQLRDLDDDAAPAGFGDVMEARFARVALGAEQTGLSLQRIKPGAGSAFGHRHRTDEEVYVVVAGSGRVRLDDEVHELVPWSAVRVAPAVARTFEAGPDGLEFLAFGTHAEDDAELL